jgi:hypothetical protein
VRFRLDYEVDVAHRRDVLRILHRLDIVVQAEGASPGAARALPVTDPGGQRPGGLRGALGTIVWRRSR